MNKWCSMSVMLMRNCLETDFSALRRGGRRENFKNYYSHREHKEHREKLLIIIKTSVNPVGSVRGTPKIFDSGVNRV